MTIEPLASVDGSITPTAESTLPLPDDGLFRGDGVFEVIRLYAGRPYARAEHLDRIERSAASIELEIDRDALEHELDALLTRHGDSDAQVRIVLTRGGRRIALIEPLASWGETVALATVSYSPTVILDGVKSLSYAANMEATRIAKGRGAEEALLVRPDRVVLEAPTSAIFWVDAGGELRTPALDTGILDSITRRVVLELAEVAEGSFELDDLLGTGEAFLASTTREIQPISAVDETRLEPGRRTAEIAAGFSERVTESLGAISR